jgi:hypothetical protein
MNVMTCGTYIFLYLCSFISLAMTERGEYMTESVERLIVEEVRASVMVRELPPRVREITEPPQRSFSGKLELLARRLAANANANFLDVPFERIAQEKLKHDIALTLDHIDREREVVERLRTELRDREHLFGQELHAVTHPRAYSEPFGASEPVKKRLLAIEKETRTMSVAHEQTLRELHDRLWHQINQLVTVLTATERSHGQPVYPRRQT